MKQVLDLHIHSSFSRACSSQLTLPNIEKTCRVKGVDIIASGDFTHPQWFFQLKKQLKETFSGSGLYYLKGSLDKKVKFILATEFFLIYKENDKVRKVHLIVLAPNLAAVERLNKALAQRFNLKSDGRPILGISAPEFVRLVLAIDSTFLIYPAHIWTPWFSVLGAKSGFDSVEECFQEEIKHIYAIETGLSSDPTMISRVLSLDKFTILSSSDAHSLSSIGREATVVNIEGEISYQKIYQLIRQKNKKENNKILYTIELYPQIGKYYLDGHRSCNFSSKPKDSKRLKYLCPKCQKPLTIGVLSRVEILADRNKSEAQKLSQPFKKIIELDKIITEVLGLKNRQAKKVQLLYQHLINNNGSELDILLNLDLQLIKTNLETNLHNRLIKAIKQLREGKLQIEPGFDGSYGQVKFFV